MTVEHPLGDVTSGLPEWVRWMLHGIVVGQPLNPDAVRRHIVDADPAPELPEIPDLDTASPVRLTELRLGPGCYGLADGTKIEFGHRLTLIYGENGTGKSSLARILRAVSGRPSAQRPPHNTFTGVPATATLAAQRDGSVTEHHWQAGATTPPFHIEVFDSVDTRIEGTEYQVRPRSVLALEDLRVAIDALRIAVEPLAVPADLRAALTDDDLCALDEPATAVGTMDGWLAEAAPRTAAAVQQALADLGDEALAWRRADVEREGRLARADTTLVAALDGLDLPELARRLSVAASSTPDLGGSGPPQGVDPTTWLAFVRLALPLFETSPQRCVLCDSDIAGRHADLVVGYDALLADQRAAVAQAADNAAEKVRDAVLAHRGATDGAASPAGGLAADLVEALGARDPDQLGTAVRRISQVATSSRERLENARTQWQASTALLADAEGRRAALRHELTVARRAEALSGNPQAVGDLRDRLRHRERLAAAARPQGTKQRINTALKRHTEFALESVYGQTLGARLERFKVPHIDLLTARHAAKGGQARRRHIVGKTSADALFSEGEQRALALADFAAELDTRADTRHPVVIDDPVSSLDYRRLENVVEYVRDLVRQDRQVVVLTHSLWLAAALLKDVTYKRDGTGPDRAWTLVRTGGRLGATARLSTSVLGSVEGLEARIGSLIVDAERESDLTAQHELVVHGLGLLRAWCESFVEQKVLCGAVARLDWQVKPGKLVDVDQGKIDRGHAVASLHERLHQRIDAHAQPGELMHRPDGLADLKELWTEAKRVRDGRSTN
ncbi:MAG: AAA family ATPase [Nocardioidaceae bacterium]